MTVGASRFLDVTGTYAEKQIAVSAEMDNSAIPKVNDNESNPAIDLQVTGLASTTGKEKKDSPKNQNEEEMDLLTKTINKFMENFTADLRFSMHDRTHRLMVQLVDVKHNKVLKEFPPKEFLDMVANIRDCVGAILDKKV